MANSETILSAQTHIGDSNIQSVTGEKYKGDGYYGRSDGFHTVQYTINGFIGVLNIQATLAIDPLETDWFTIYTQTCTTVTTGTFVTNFTGNYVWVRATVTDWSDGAVNSIKLNH
jgi:hypothetical protein